MQLVDRLCQLSSWFNEFLLDKLLGKGNANTCTYEETKDTASGHFLVWLLAHDRPSNVLVFDIGDVLLSTYPPRVAPTLRLGFAAAVALFVAVVYARREQAVTACRGNMFGRQRRNPWDCRVTAEETKLDIGCQVFCVIPMRCAWCCLLPWQPNAGIVATSILYL